MCIIGRSILNNQVDLGFWAQRLANPEGIEMATAYKVRELSDKYVPFLGSDLSNHIETTHDNDGAHIIYTEPYAHRQFKGVTDNGIPFKYTTTHHPNARSHWIEPVKQDAINRVTSFAKEAILHGTNI